MSSLDYLDLCRLCLVKDRVSVPIFEGEGDVRQIFLKIAACLPVKVAREDKLPKKICDDCVYKVELFYQFWNTTANAEKQLLQWLGEVGLEDKQGYVTNVLNPNVMKQEQNTENRLDGNVMQPVSEHQNNIGMGMMDNMGLGIPMIISSTNQQEMTSVPMDTGGNSVQTVQAVPGPSTQATHNQISQNQTNTAQQDDEEESSEEDNSDEECDGDEGLPVKEEGDEDPSSGRTIEPTTFVNVSLACDEAGPSGLQQQKIADMPEMAIAQPAEGDPKSGQQPNHQASIKQSLTTNSSGGFIIGKDSVPMELWQQVDSNGKLHYSQIPPLNDTKSTEKTITTSSPIVPVSNEENAGQNGVQKTVNCNVNRYMDSLVHLCEVAIDCYTCEKCGMKFPVENMLNRHKLSHNLTSWLRRKHLIAKHARRTKLHVRKERKQIPVQKQLQQKHGYTCSICEFGCNRRITLTMHIRKKHQLGEAKSEARKVQCTICDYECETQADLKRHMWEHRNAETMHFTCGRCKFECKWSTTLASHVTQCHRKRVEGEEGYGKKRKGVKYEYGSLEKSEGKGKKGNSVGQETTEEFECKKESLDRTGARVNKKQSKKTAEERCNLCDFKCSAKSTLYSHKRQHKVENVSEVYACNECGFKTSKKSSLYSHIKRKHKVTRSCTGEEQPELFYCNQCDYKNKNKYELKVHVARKHTDDFKFSCETCGKKFKVKGDLTNHIRFSHREQPVICDVCGKTCLNSNSLYVHQKFAHYKAKFECQVCKRRMVSQENLNEHMLRQHERRENVVCEECGKTFSRNSRLKVHMRIHTGDKPYTCTICSKSFARRTALKQHMLIHTGIRPYVCDICGKAFTQKPGLISHRKSHPGSHPPLPRVLIDHILNDVMNN